MANLSRRQLALFAAAASLAPAALFAQSPPLANTQPVIIADGGSAETHIEDTRSALLAAIDEGADFLQVNVFPTKEGGLVARRDHEIGASTDVSAHPEFADRRTTKSIDGADVAGWFTEDFTLPELQTLACREAQPTLRSANSKLDGKEPMLTIGEVLQIARDGCVKTGRVIGVCARMIRTAYFETQDLHVGERLAQELETQGYIAPAAAVWVQAGDADALKTFARLSRVRRMQMIEPGPYAAQMTTAAALADIRRYAQAIGPHQDLLIDPAAATFPAPTTLALDAHNAGLQVFSHTARGQNAFLPPQLRRAGRGPGDRGDVDKLLAALFSDLLDGVSTDLPSNADKARRAVADAIARQRTHSG